jgi:hypothetical protein
MIDRLAETYFEELKELEVAALFLTERTDLLEEIRSNMISLGLPGTLSKSVSVENLQSFLQRVKRNRLQQLADSSLNVHLIYYLWVDEMAGRLRAGFINSNHSKLPFACSYQLVDSEEKILTAFLQSPWLNGIPWEELSPTVENKQLVEEGTGFELAVFQEELRCI